MQYKDALCLFLAFHMQMKSYHFTTKTYSKHKASDAFIKKYEKLYDKFIEACQGRHGQFKLKEFSLKIEDCSEKNIVQLCKNHIITLEGLNYDDSCDLMAIRDEIVAEINKLCFILRLN